jgi:hypothetical protein
MKKNNIIILGVIGLLLILGLTPAASGSYFNNDETDINELIDVEVIDYKEDGTTETRVVKLNLLEIKNFKKDYLNTKSVDEKLQILQKYKLVSEETSLLEWKYGMLSIAKELGINYTQISNLPKIKAPIMISFLNKIDTVHIGGIAMRIGITPILRIINRIIPKLNLQRIDLLNIYTGLFGVTFSDGLFSSHMMMNLLSVNAMLGFVGTGVKIPLIMNVFAGYSAVTFSMGLGFHIKNWKIPEIPI